MITMGAETIKGGEEVNRVVEDFRPPVEIAIYAMVEHTVKWTVGYMSTLMAIMKGSHLNSLQKSTEL